jgi:1-phosphofructokinase family hexose kinase
VTLNPAIDKSYRVERLEIDRIHRPLAATSSAGGKGINAARVVSRMGRTVLATGFLGGFNGRFIEQALAQEGIPADFVWVSGESRLAIGISETSRPTDTKLDEWGPEVAAADVEAMVAKVEGLLTDADAMVIAGSAPPGCPPEIYRRLTAAGRARGVRVVLDVYGAPLQEGLRGCPDLIKPNRFELQELCGRTLSYPEETIAAARALCVEYGVPQAVISAAAEGCVAVEGDRAWTVRPPAVPFVSAVGSGDALAAGLAIGLAEGWDLPTAARFGVAAATANVSTLGPGDIHKDDVERLREAVVVESCAPTAAGAR